MLAAGAAGVEETLELLVSVEVSALEAWARAAAAWAALTCAGVSTSSRCGAITISSVVNWNSSGCSGDPSGMVVLGRRSSSKNVCSHAYKMNRVFTLHGIRRRDEINQI